MGKAVESTELTLDPAAIARLHKIGGEDLVRQMTQLFLRNATRRLAAARDGFAQGDYERIAKSMHALKSSAGNIGANRLGQMAIRAESMAEAQIAEELVPLLDQMDAEFQQVRKALEAGEVQEVMQTVAIVEDNPDNRLLLSTMLNGQYRPVEYGTGPDSLEGMRAEPPDLVLLDISLPGMDGVEVLQHLREEEPTQSIPVVALTAHATEGDREKYLARGFDGYLTKPILDERELFDIIDRLLR